MIDVNVTGKMRIALLIDLYDCVEELVYALACATDRRHHRHTQQITQLLDVQFVALLLKFVIHIESHHHAEVHVYELGGEVQVSLQVGCVDYIDDYVRHVLKEILPYI